MVMSAITDDLTAVFDTAVFAVEATWTDQLGISRLVKGIFDREDTPTEDASFPQYVKVTKFTCKSADIVGVAPNDKLVVEGETFRLAYTVDDGVGVTELYLSTDDIPDAR